MRPGNQALLSSRKAFDPYLLGSHSYAHLSLECSQALNRLSSFLKLSETGRWEVG